MSHVLDIQADIESVESPSTSTRRKDIPCGGNRERMAYARCVTASVSPLHARCNTLLPAGTFV